MAVHSRFLKTVPWSGVEVSVFQEAVVSRIRYWPLARSFLLRLILPFVALACSGDPARMLAPRAFSLSRSEAPNPRIIPPNGRYAGLTYGEWLAKSFQLYYANPVPDNSNLLGNEDKLLIGQPDHLWIIQSATPPPQERHFTVPVGTALYITIFTWESDNFLCVEPNTDLTLPELRALAKSFVDGIPGPFEVEVDGRRVENVTQYRSTSPVFSSTLPDNNLLQLFGCADALPGTYGPMVADGYALILPPPPVGEHTIRESFQNYGDNVWHITVVPRRQ
jgi:hypothetical protein